VTGRVAAAALVAVVLAAWPVGPATATARSSRLPPDDEASIAQLFDAALAPLGLHVSRASLEQPPRYTPNPRGRHLAVYTLPTGVYTSADYLANVTRVAQVFLPKVFRRWSGLESFDVCQEPLPALNPDPEAPPITRLFVTRAGAARVDWSRVTAAQLLKATPKRETAATSLSLYVDTDLLREPAYRG
jgi:hypothetical protein